MPRPRAPAEAPADAPAASGFEDLWVVGKSVAHGWVSPDVRLGLGGAAVDEVFEAYVCSFVRSSNPWPHTQAFWILPVSTSLHSQSISGRLQADCGANVSHQCICTRRQKLTTHAGPIDRIDPLVSPSALPWWQRCRCAMEWPCGPHQLGWMGGYWLCFPPHPARTTLTVHATNRTPPQTVLCFFCCGSASVPPSPPMVIGGALGGRGEGTSTATIIASGYVRVCV